MSKENPTQDWNKLWNEYNKSLKSWRDALESLQKAAIDVQSKYNKAMAKAIKDSNGKTMSQFIENWQKAMCEAGTNAFKPSGETGKSKPTTKKSIDKKSGKELNDLITLGNSLGANTFVLQDATKILNDSNQNNDKSVCGKLGMFINQVNQSPKLNPEQKGQLITAAKAIKTSLGCKSS